MLDVVWPRCSLREHLLFLKNSFTKSYQLHWNHDIRNAFIMKTLVDIGAPVYTFFSCFVGEWVSYQLIGVFLGFAKTIVGLLLCVMWVLFSVFSVFLVRYLVTVTKVSTCWVNSTSRQEVKRLGISDHYRRRRLSRRLPTYPSPKFLLVLFSFHFPTKRGKGHIQSCWGKFLPPTSLMKALGDCIWWK